MGWLHEITCNSIIWSFSEDFFPGKVCLFLQYWMIDSLQETAGLKVGVSSRINEWLTKTPDGNRSPAPKPSVSSSRFSGFPWPLSSQQQEQSGCWSVCLGKTVFCPRCITNKEGFRSREDSPKQLPHYCPETVINQNAVAQIYTLYWSVFSACSINYGWEFENENVKLS